VLGESHWSLNNCRSKGERTSAAKAAILASFYGTAEAVPLSNTFQSQIVFGFD